MVWDCECESDDDRSDNINEQREGIKLFMDINSFQHVYDVQGPKSDHISDMVTIFSKHLSEEYIELTVEHTNLYQ
jgi:hypothetical protein